MKLKSMMSVLLIFVVCFSAGAQQKKNTTPAPSGKPNIVIIWGDDIGQSNISAYSMGVMGYHTPNIDRVAKEGVMFHRLLCRAKLHCRPCFVYYRSMWLRTGLTKVGMPGATVGLQKEDPTIAELLKGQGYATGQFGKNHLGDRDEFLPTMHGFDEFYGNLYHLNAEEEPEDRDYPSEKDFPGFKEKFGPRGVLHCYANADGTQTIENTGPLTKKRMETIDDETAKMSAEYLEKQVKAGKPVFLVGKLYPHALSHTCKTRKSRSIWPLAK